MVHILFWMLPETGHHKATLHVADLLVARGHDVTYISAGADARMHESAANGEMCLASLPYGRHFKLRLRHSR